MTHKPEFLDYEPLTRVNSKRTAEKWIDEEGFGSEARAKAGHSEIDTKSAKETVVQQGLHGTEDWAPVRRISRAQSEVLDSPNQTESPHRTVEVLEHSGRRAWILKRGHSLSFAGLFLFTFLVYFRPYELFESLSWLSSSAFWIAFLTLIVFLPTQLSLDGTITARPREVNLVLLLTLTALLSVPFALEPLTAWNSFTGYLKVIVMFIVMVNVVRTEKRLKSLIVLILAASVLLSLGGVNDYRLGNLALQGRRIEGVIGGIFSNPNDLALHLVTMVPLTVGLLLSTSSYLKKLLYWFCALILIAGVIVAFSRGGFLALGCAICFLTWKLAPRSRVVFGVLGLALVLGLIALAPGAFRSRLTKDASAVARTDDLKRSIFLAVRNPIFGIGIGNYVFYSNQAKATHNAYTQVAAELGLAAAVFYILFIIGPFKGFRTLEREYRASRKKPPHYYFAITLQASLVGYMVASFFASVAFLWYVYYLVGYAICLRRILESSRDPDRTALTEA